MLLFSRASLQIGLLVSFLVLPLLAVFLDEAYTIDFHYALLGQPQASNTFFHQPVKNSKASLIFTLSDRSVLAAVNPKDGAILWRHHLPANVSASPPMLRAGADPEVIFSGAGTKVSAWNAADGRLAWQKDFTPLSIRAMAVHSTSELLVSLSGNANSLSKLDSSTGKFQWTYQDQSGDTPHAILTSPGLVHLVSLRSAMLKGLKLKITTLNAKDGSRKSDQTLATDSDIRSSDDIVFLGSSSNDPFIAWTDAAKKTLKIYTAGASNFQSFDIPARIGAIETVSMHTAAFEAQPGTSSSFIVRYQSSTAHWADIFRAHPQKQSIAHAVTISSMPGKGTFSATVVDGKTYFVRISADQTTVMNADDEVPLYKWDTAFTVPGLLDQPSPVHATAEVAIRPSSPPALRASVLLSTGDWVLVRNGETQWSRPEALAAISNTQWADLTEKESLSEKLKIDSSRNLLVNMVRRIARHLSEAPSISLLTASIRSTVLGQLFSSDSMTNEAFGFNKLMIVQTANNRLMALDTGNRGRVLWNIDGAGLNGKCLPNSAPQSITQQLSCLGELPSMSSGAPSWARLTKYRDPFLKFDQNDLLHSVATSDTQGPAVRYSFEDSRLRGYSATDNSQDLWTFQPLAGHRIVSVKHQMSFEPVASIGKVLADRRVLYKYLNANAIIVLTVDDGKRQAIANLVDTISGTVLYSSRHEHVDTSRPITSAISENWMAFAYTMDSAQDSVSKGFQLVMAEFYESSIPDDRGASGAATNFSTLHGPGTATKPYVYSQSFHVPEEITQMVVTQTGQGITSRQLLVGLEASNSIVSIPPQAVDPRRTVGREPTNPEKYEEGLSRYSPMIDFDPKWYLNHKEEILGLDQIMTTPSLLESTSLVFACGLDVFGTRISPSFGFDILGTDFNKIQLVLTVIGLLAGVFVVAPIITRKQTNMLWQNL